MNSPRSILNESGIVRCQTKQCFLVKIFPMPVITKESVTSVLDCLPTEQNSVRFKTTSELRDSPLREKNKTLDHTSCIILFWKLLQIAAHYRM
jgi:hypothetical protein